MRIMELFTKELLFATIGVTVIVAIFAPIIYKMGRDIRLQEKDLDEKDERRHALHKK